MAYALRVLVDDIVDVIIDDVVAIAMIIIITFITIITIIVAYIKHSIYSLLLLLLLLLLVLLLFAMKYLPAVVYHLHVDHHLHTMLIIIVLNNILIGWLHGFDIGIC